MYDKNLINIIATGANLKFRLKNDQQSKELQEMLYTLGFEWPNIYKPYMKVLQNYFHLYLTDASEHRDYNKRVILFSNDEKYFLEDSASEYDIENKCLKKGK